MDLSALFVPGPQLGKFESLRAELQEIRSGNKAMSVFCFSLEDIGSSEHKEVMVTALDMGLSVDHHVDVIDPTSRAYQQLYVFVLNPGESWRIAAYLASRRILREYQWSDGAEYLESYLLGYSAEDISAWLMHHHSRRASWTGFTLYFLITHQQMECIKELGMKCLNPKSISDKITVFFSRRQDLVRRDATELVPEGKLIVRAAVEYEFFRKLFDPVMTREDFDVVSVILTRQIIEPLNAALESNFQVLSEGNWR